MRGCAPDNVNSNDGVDASVRVCDNELCNDSSIMECKDCECFDSGSGALTLAKSTYLYISVFAVTVLWLL